MEVTLLNLAIAGYSFVSWWAFVLGFISYREHYDCSVTPLSLLFPTYFLGYFISPVSEKFRKALDGIFTFEFYRWKRK